MRKPWWRPDGRIFYRAAFANVLYHIFWLPEDRGGVLLSFAALLYASHLIEVEIDEMD
jgi:hypothetical protein